MNQGWFFHLSNLFQVIYDFTEQLDKYCKAGRVKLVWGCWGEAEWISKIHIFLNKAISGEREREDREKKRGELRERNEEKEST